MLLDYKIQEGQSLYDVCLMLYGEMDYLFKLIQDNNVTLSIGNLVGVTVIYDNTVGIDNKIALQRTGRIKYLTNYYIQGLSQGAKITEDNEIKYTEEGGIKIIE